MRETMKFLGLLVTTTVISAMLGVGFVAWLDSDDSIQLSSPVVALVLVGIMLVSAWAAAKVIYKNIDEE